VIASPSNLALLREAGLLGEAAIAAGPNDLLIAAAGPRRAGACGCDGGGRGGAGRTVVATSGNSPVRWHRAASP